MKHPIIIGLSLIICAGMAFAQAPKKFSFQGVARDAIGKMLASGSKIEVHFTIHQNAAGGQVAYDEVHHNVEVRAGGVFNAEIGGGEVKGGDLSTIDWGVDTYFLQVGLDLGNGQIHDLGATQLLSVPFSLHAGVAESWRHHAPIVQRGTLGVGGTLGAVGDGPRLIWHPGKAAFLAGLTTENIASEVNLGEGSVSLGSLSRASGDASISAGYGVHAKAFGSASFGLFNNALDAPSAKQSGAAATDRIFQVGNGTSDQATSNALTILRNGNVGIGNASVAPGFLLDVGGRGRFRHNGQTSGIHFDNSANSPAAFVGMITDQKVGFYIGNKWIFQAASNGYVGIGALTDLPEYTLDVAGRARLRHIGATSGLYFDDSQNNASAFVGMMNDKRVGFYIGNKWSFHVTDLQGAAGGNNSTSNGTNALAFGNGALADGNESVALGEGTVAKAWGAMTVGAWNNVQDNSVASKAGLKATDRIFQIGNGTAGNNLSNAVTVLRNGNVGIGNTSLFPTHILDVGGRGRFRHNGYTAGIYFDDSQNNAAGFAGMMTDNTVGFYIGNQWRIQAHINSGVNIIGNLGVSGIVSQSSDRRLKRDFTHLSGSLEKLTSLQGYHYYWKDKQSDQSLQTGLIAQEVEELFPELVSVNSDGIKSLNYTGLIPHLIESIKDLQQQNAVLRGEKNQIADKLNALAAKVDQLLEVRSPDHSR